jgi:2-polyprenyl-6-methoxyphenol hydroxylase-like FAD-dependent oxidoreductase
MAATPRILIVGAGLGGLALARILQDSRLDVQVIERLSVRDRGTGI